MDDSDDGNDLPVEVIPVKVVEFWMYIYWFRIAGTCCLLNSLVGEHTDPAILRSLQINWLEDQP